MKGHHSDSALRSFVVKENWLLELGSSTMCSSHQTWKLQIVKPGPTRKRLDGLYRFEIHSIFECAPKTGITIQNNVVHSVSVGKSCSRMSAPCATWPPCPRVTHSNGNECPKCIQVNIVQEERVAPQFGPSSFMSSPATMLQIPAVNDASSQPGPIQGLSASSLNTFWPRGAGALQNPACRRPHSQLAARKWVCIEY